MTDDKEEQEEEEEEEKTRLTWDGDFISFPHSIRGMNHFLLNTHKYRTCYVVLPTPYWNTVFLQFYEAKETFSHGFFRNSSRVGRASIKKVRGAPRKWIKLLWSRWQQLQQQQHYFQGKKLNSVLSSFLEKKFLSLPPIQSCSCSPNNPDVARNFPCFENVAIIIIIWEVMIMLKLLFW